MKISEDEFIIKLRHGEGQALTLLFDEYYTALHYFAFRLIENNEEAEDIVLDIFGKLWTRRENFESLVNIKAFLYIATRNTCFNYLHQKRRHAGYKKDLAYLADMSNEERSEQLKIEAELLRNIHTAIEKLPDRCRIVFELTYFEGLKTDEIAKKLNITISTVTSQRHRAIQLLRAFFDIRTLGG
jgi:RNA polymerase sigma-70 factor (ECF subfamily)